MAADTGATEARTDGATAIQAAAHLTFGTTGNAVPSQVSGFSWPEDGYTWALGPQAVLRVKLQPGHGDLMLELSLRPFMLPPYMVRQRVGLTVDGTEIGVEWAQDDSVLGFRIPAALVEGSSEILIKLALPDAASPSDLHAGGDSRRLGGQIRGLLLVWIPPEPKVTPRRLPPLPCGPDDPPERLAELARFCTGLDLPQLAEHFESLGHNCEFGLVQRACGAEPQGLLRFVGIAIHRLLEGLDFGFEGVDDPALVRAYPGTGPDPEWLLRNDRYGMHAHSFLPVTSIDEATFVAQQIKRVRLQRRRLLEVLETGQNLFVFQRQEPMTEAHALPLLTLLRSYGPNALLFVTMDAEKPSGSVDQLGPHLFRGNIDKLAPVHEAGSFQKVPWVSICANAYRLWRETGHGT
jgi:hypothetical protein